MRKSFLLSIVLVMVWGLDCFAQQELPLPTVPSQLRQPKERAEYIIEHFWDGMEFCDTLKSHDRKFMEQNMVNWFSLFPHVPENRLDELIYGFLAQAAVDSLAFRIVADIAEEYLYTPYSPMHNEGHFIAFFEQVLRSGRLGQTERIRPAYLLETAKKNRPGKKAADFKYIIRRSQEQGKNKTTGYSLKDKVRTLHKTDAERLLLVFYSPDCHYCKITTEKLERSVVIQELVRSGKLKVLAVYAEGNRELWETTKDALPQTWLVGFEIGDIMDRNLYALPTMPVIYLLDRNKKVEQKETTVEAVEELLRSEN